MSPPGFCLSLETSLTTSPLSTVELFHSALSRVEETTYLGMPLNLSANSPSSDGQALANPWYVTRPSSSASELRVSLSLKSPTSSPCAITKDHPACLKPESPPGSSMTPSSETNSVTTIRPILISPFYVQLPCDQLLTRASVTSWLSRAAALKSEVSRFLVTANVIPVALSPPANEPTAP